MTFALIRAAQPHCAIVFSGVFAALLAGTLAVHAGVTKSSFGQVDDVPVDLYTLTSSDGAEARVMTYGATLVSLKVPDRNGRLGDVVLGFDSLSGYLDTKHDPYFGATVGRYANRIAQGRFTLDGKTYQLATNNGPNALHGGIKGFDKRLWQAKILSTDPPTVRFTRISPAGEEGYPGTLHASVTYSWNDEHELKLVYRATTDAPTVVNLSHHSYFNLSLGHVPTILKDRLTIRADAYTPVDRTLIPTGEIRSVDGTPFDFRHPTEIGQRIAETGGDPVGYDHNFVLLHPNEGVRENCTVEDPLSGRRLRVSSDQPGLQFYSGNFLDGTIVGKGGVTYPHWGALCLEPQHFPDSPNQPRFPSVVLRPGEVYSSTLIYGFDTVPR